MEQPKKMGRPRIERAPSARRPVKRLVTNEPISRATVSLRDSDFDYLATFNPHNLSDAIRQVIELAKSIAI